MNNINRYNEPENLIDQSGSLKLKWAAMIAVIGIALLIFLSGCTHEEYKKVVVTYTNGETELITVPHDVYSDGSFSGLYIKESCLKRGDVHKNYPPIRCGVRHFYYTK